MSIPADNDAFKKIRALFPIPSLTMHYVVRDDAGIFSRYVESRENAGHALSELRYVDGLCHRTPPGSRRPT